MTLGDHLEDLRRRLMLAVLGIAPIAIVALYFGDTLLGLLIKPVQAALRKQGLPAQLMQTSPMETFFGYFHISIIVSVVVGAPWLVYQVWKFIAPGLYKHERRFVHLLLPFSGVLSIAGVLFMYFVILPFMLAYFVNFGTKIGTPHPPVAEVPAGVVLPVFPVLSADPPNPVDGQVWINKVTHEICAAMDGSILRTEMGRGAAIVQQYKVKEWIDFFLDLCLAFAIGFQTPIIVMLLGWVGIIDRAFMKKYRRHAIMAILVGAALLTPADPISLFLMSVPMYLLYELGGVLFTYLTPERVAYGRKGKPPEDDDNTPAPPGQGDGSFYREDSALRKKVIDLVPNTLASAGLLPKDRPNDNEPS